LAAAKGILSLPTVTEQNDRARHHSVPAMLHNSKRKTSRLAVRRRSTRWNLIATNVQVRTNPMFHKKSRRLQRQASFSGVASKLMDATSEKSRKLSRQINKMARVQEEKELQEKREQEEAAQEEKKKKEEGFARSIITRKLSIFGSYRRMSF
ncbi:unnamed protein product, partial [Porites evermanni]